VEDHSPSQVEIIGQLAKEYERKQKELEELVTGVPEDQIFAYLQALSERTTDRFRTAQMALFSAPGVLEGTAGSRTLQAATALCRAFDEMRILFGFLFENATNK
jgi:hypothetical protein